MVKRYWLVGYWIIGLKACVVLCLMASIYWIDRCVIFSVLPDSAELSLSHYRTSHPNIAIHCYILVLVSPTFALFASNLDGFSQKSNLPSNLKSTENTCFVISITVVIITKSFSDGSWWTVIRKLINRSINVCDPNIDKWCQRSSSHICELFTHSYIWKANKLGASAMSLL